MQTEQLIVRAIAEHDQTLLDTLVSYPWNHCFLGTFKKFADNVGNGYAPQAFDSYISALRSFYNLSSADFAGWQNVQDHNRPPLFPGVSMGSIIFDADLERWERQPTPEAPPPSPSVAIEVILLGRIFIVDLDGFNHVLASFGHLVRPHIVPMLVDAALCCSDVAVGPVFLSVLHDVLNVALDRVETEMKSRPDETTSVALLSLLRATYTIVAPFAAMDLASFKRCIWDLFSIPMSGFYRRRTRILVYFACRNAENRGLPEIVDYCAAVLDKFFCHYSGCCNPDRFLARKAKANVSGENTYFRDPHTGMQYCSELCRDAELMERLLIDFDQGKQQEEHPAERRDGNDTEEEDHALEQDGYETQEETIHVSAV